MRREINESALEQNKVLRIKYEKAIEILKIVALDINTEYSDHNTIIAHAILIDLEEL